jgi:hypothetical protein
MKGDTQAVHTDADGGSSGGRVAGGAAALAPQEEQHAALLASAERKLNLRIMPCLSLLSILCYLDRANLSFASGGWVRAAARPALCSQRRAACLLGMACSVLLFFGELDRTCMHWSVSCNQPGAPLRPKQHMQPPVHAPHLHRGLPDPHL